MKMLFFNNIVTVSPPKKCFERTVIHEHRGSHCKSDESTDRGIEKWFSGMLPEAL
jgi:hypothetical protein